MYRTIETKIKDLQNMLNTSDIGNNPQILIITKNNDNEYGIIAEYYNENTHKAKRVEYITDDYKTALNKYIPNKNRVVIYDLI